MNTFSMIGATVVTLALISYSIGVITEQTKRAITKTILAFITIGVILDITATIFMIIGSTNSPFTLHGFLGYSALLAMLVDVILIWDHFKRNGVEVKVTKGLNTYTLLAYLWWIIAYITGSLLVMMK